MIQPDSPTLPSTRPDPEARILAAAGKIFLRDGFAGASVDAVAALARMSKLTIYSLFPNKAALFEAAVRGSIDKHDIEFPAAATQASLEESLAVLGERMFDRFLDPVNFGLFRANIEAANQFPDLAADLHRHRRKASQYSAHVFQAWIDQGRLEIEDAITAVIRFSALCVQGSRHFLGVPPPPAEARAQTVGRVITLFLDGYGAATSGVAPVWPAPSEPVQRSHSATRMSPARVEQVISAIREEFLENGYLGASVDRAVAAIGVGKATVYRQFGNKEAVFRHIVEQIIRAEERRDFELVALTGTPRAELTDLARAVLQAHCARDNVRVHRLLIQEAVRFPDLARRFYETRVNRLGRLLSALLARHNLPIADGPVITDFYNLATSALRFLTGDEPPSDDQIRSEAGEIARIFLSGVRAMRG